MAVLGGVSCAGGRYGAARISSGSKRAAACRALGLQLVGAHGTCLAAVSSGEEQKGGRGRLGV
ncbi:hypothetical protein MHH92_30435 [Paenibacillus sp. FSL M7-1414]|uniref:hypothetical protein n=1 Tax=Paenibacillus sp. FSL M7-1414 TaxID=2921542 RepID=UPI0030F6680F